VGVAEVGGPPLDEATGVGVTAKVMVELGFGVLTLLESVEELESDNIEWECDWMSEMESDSCDMSDFGSIPRHSKRNGTQTCT
jgi:hypothetical protein